MEVSRDQIIALCNRAIAELRQRGYEAFYRDWSIGPSVFFEGRAADVSTEDSESVRAGYMFVEGCDWYVVMMGLPRVKAGSFDDAFALALRHLESRAEG